MKLIFKDELFTASIDLLESEPSIGDIRTKNGKQIVKEIFLNDNQLENIKRILDCSEQDFSKYFGDISFIADVEFKNIRIAQYKKLGD